MRPRSLLLLSVRRSSSIGADFELMQSGAAEASGARLSVCLLAGAARTTDEGILIRAKVTNAANARALRGWPLDADPPEADVASLTPRAIDPASPGPEATSCVSGAPHMHRGLHPATIKVAGCSTCSHPCCNEVALCRLGGGKRKPCTL